MKTCCRCKETLSLSCFYASRHAADGKQTRCKACDKIYQKERVEQRREYEARYQRPPASVERKKIAYAKWLAANKDAVAARVREYHSRPEIKVILARRSREHRRRHPEKYQARYLVSNAIESGRLIPSPCVRCGAEKTHGHHEDYSKPLDVIWLCRPCHVQRHREIKAGG